MTNKKERVGLFGGSFNPIHVGHLIMAERVRETLGLDKIYFMPTNIAPHVDTKKNLPADVRVEMVKLAIQENPYFELELVEMEREEKSYTYDTIRILKERYPDREYVFIIGGDMVEYLPKWYKIEDLLTEVQFVAVARKGYHATSPYPVLWVENPVIEISSTLVRNACANEQSIRYYVPESVRMYIEQKELYR